MYNLQTAYNAAVSNYLAAKAAYQASYTGEALQVLEMMSRNWGAVARDCAAAFGYADMQSFVDAAESMGAEAFQCFAPADLSTETFE